MLQIAILESYGIVKGIIGEYVNSCIGFSTLSSVEAACTRLQGWRWDECCEKSDPASSWTETIKNRIKKVACLFCAADWRMTVLN